ncbi:MAG TPA: folate family ECF transporter S component [Clostridia bacterium]
MNEQDNFSFDLNSENQPQNQKPPKPISQFFRLDATRRVTYLAVLIGLAIVLKLYGIDLPYGKVSLFYIPCYLAGAFFGPVVGFATGALGDVLGFLIKGGTPNLILTLGNGLMGFIVGAAFKFLPSLKPEIRLVIGVYVSMFVCTLGINTLGLAVLYGSPSLTLWQNYAAQLWYGPIPRLFFQPLVITVNLGVSLALYYVLNRYFARYLGFSHQKSS